MAEADAAAAQFPARSAPPWLNHLGYARAASQGKAAHPENIMEIAWLDHPQAPSRLNGSKNNRRLQKWIKKVNADNQYCSIDKALHKSQKNQKIGNHFIFDSGVTALKKMLSCSKSG